MSAVTAVMDCSPATSRGQGGSAKDAPGREGGNQGRDAANEPSHLPSFALALPVTGGAAHQAFPTPPQPSPLPPPGTSLLAPARILPLAQARPALTRAAFPHPGVPQRLLHPRAALGTPGMLPASLPAAFGGSC